MELFKYDPHMELGYDEGGLGNSPSVETVLVIRDLESGDEKSIMFDNLTTPVYFMVSKGLVPFQETLIERPEILVPQGEREVRGTEGTAIDGVTGQAIMDGWRSQQADRTLEIVCLGDPSLIDEIL